MSQLSNRLCISCGDMHHRKNMMAHYQVCLKKYSTERQHDEKIEIEMPKMTQMTLNTDVLEGVQEDYQEIQRVPCPICERKFAIDALDRHLQSCQKINSKKPRKTFDTQKHRVAGTEAAQYVAKANANASATLNAPSSERKPSKVPKPSKFNPTFDTSKENKFAVKEVKDDGLVQCPSCSRKFNSESAERHIPYCLEQQRLSIHKKEEVGKTNMLKKRTQYKPPSPVKNKPSSGTLCSNCGGMSEDKKYCLNCGYAIK